eukprot:6205871-Pleurochrysis_carterae.AAC.3
MANENLADFVADKANNEMTCEDGQELSYYYQTLQVAMTLHQSYPALTMLLNAMHRRRVAREIIARRTCRAKPPKTSRMNGVTTCPRCSASWYFACWNAGRNHMMEESKRGSVFAKANAEPRVGRGAQPVGIGLTTLCSKSS